MIDPIVLAEAVAAVAVSVVSGVVPVPKAGFVALPINAIVGVGPPLFASTGTPPLVWKIVDNDWPAGIPTRLVVLPVVNDPCKSGDEEAVFPSSYVLIAIRLRPFRFEIPPPVPPAPVTELPTNVSFVSGEMNPNGLAIAPP